MTRPIFGPARQTLGHPATTRFLDSLMTDEERDAQRVRERNEEIYMAGIRAWFKRTDEQEKASCRP